MFMDGLLYSIIANNLANGIGSFWDLHLTETLSPHFNAHPPLTFGLQSLFFWLFGDSILVERFYALMTYIGSTWMITLIWKQITEGENKQNAWLPWLIFISIPIGIWSLSNNMLENTMLFFCTLSIYFTIKNNSSNRLRYLYLSGFAIFLAFMSKGPSSLFPLSLPFWLFVFSPKGGFKTFVLRSVHLVIATILPLGILYVMSPDNVLHLFAYFDHQVVNSLNKLSNVNSRFYILWRLINELIPAFIIIILFLYFTRKTKYTKGNTHKWAFVFIALGLSAVLPIMVSLKQASVYMTPSFTSFSIGIALLIAAKLSVLTDQINLKSKGYRNFKYSSILMLVIGVSVAIYFSSQVGRDKEAISDVKKLEHIIPNHTVVSIPNKIWQYWALHGYFHRLIGVSLDKSNTEHEFYITLIKDNNGPKGYQKMDLNLEYLNVFKKDGE